MSYLGRKVQCSHLPGLTGTIAHANVGGVGYWTPSVTYNVVWNDLTMTRAVASKALDGPEWGFLGTQRMSENECNLLWYQYLMNRSEILAKRAKEDRIARESSRGNAISTGGRSDAFRQFEKMYTVPKLPDSDVPSSRKITPRVKSILSNTIPGVNFAVHSEKGAVIVSWLDGPVSGFVYGSLAPLLDEGFISSVKTKRSLTEEHIQNSINYCLSVVFKNDQTSSDFQVAKIRLSPSDYFSGLLDCVFPPLRHSMSGISFQRMIRCVSEKWDCHREKFVFTKVTSTMTEELSAMFPLGEWDASLEYRRVLYQCSIDSQEAMRVFDAYSMRSRNAA